MIHADSLSYTHTLNKGMMLGIRVTTGRQILPMARSSSSSLQEHELSPADYTETVTLDFHPQGNNAPPYPTPPHKLPFTFQFKDYMSNVFRAVRALNNIDEAEYMMSLAGKDTVIMRSPTKEAMPHSHPLLAIFTDRLLSMSLIIYFHSLFVYFM